VGEIPTRHRSHQPVAIEAAVGVPKYRFYARYDKIYREDILGHA